MLHITNLNLPIDGGEALLRRRAAKLLRIPPEDLLDLQLVKQSIDARKKKDLHLVCSVNVSVRQEEAVLRRLGPDARRTYALAFITFEEHRSRPMPFCSGFGSDITEERILSIMKYKKASLLSLVLALLVVAGAASLFATSAQAKGAPGAAAPQAQPTVPAVDRPAAPPFGTADSPQIYQSQDGCGTYVCDVVHTPGVCQTCGETHHSAHEAHHRETHSSHHGHHIG